VVQELPRGWTLFFILFLFFICAELEYVIQELPRSSIITISLSEQARLTPHLGAIATGFFHLIFLHV
jgi:hypothetical protein